MGYDIKLKIFTIRLKKYNARKNADRLWGEAFDLFEGNTSEKFNAFFKSYVESFEGKYIKYKNWPKAITIPQLDIHFNSTRRFFYGKFEGGPTNQTFTVKKLDNSDDGIIIDKDQVTSSPFYFIFHLPENSNIGLLIVQSLGEYSMHDILKLNFQLFVRGINPEFQLSYNEKITQEAIDSYKKGDIKSISIRKSGLSKDEGDNIFVKKYSDYGNIKIELKISFLDRLSNKLFVDDVKKQLFGKNPQIFEVEALESLGINEDSDLFAKFEHKGKQVMAKVDDGVKLSPVYLVAPQDVPLDADNHPDQKRMNEYLLSFMEKTIKDVGL